jgi:hypothetical protein
MLNTIVGMLSGGAAATDYESISTVTVGSGGTSTISFTSIPSTYTHLQVRAFGQTNRSTYGLDSVLFTVNGDTTNSNYAYHILAGDGATAYSAGPGVDRRAQFAWALGTTTGSNWGNGVIDILDYANTNKFKTIRSFGGVDTNGTVGGIGGTVGIGSNLWMNTSAVTSITITPFIGSTISQYSSFALYGIK